MGMATMSLNSRMRREVGRQRCSEKKQMMIASMNMEVILAAEKNPTTATMKIHDRQREQDVFDSRACYLIEKQVP